MSTNAERAAALAGALRAAIDGDADALRAACTDDVRVWTPQLSTGSIDELLAALAGRDDDAFSEHHLDVVPLDVAGDFACVEWTLTMTHSAGVDLDGRTIEPTGLRIEIHGATVAEFDGDRICAVRQYWNELDALEQIGVVNRDRD